MWDYQWEVGFYFAILSVSLKKFSSSLRFVRPLRVDVSRQRELEAILHSVGHCQNSFSLPQSASLTAPSSEGAFGRSRARTTIQQSDKLKFNEPAAAVSLCSRLSSFHSTAASRRRQAYS